MDKLKLMKLGQQTILNEKIEGLKIKIERSRDELLLYLSIDEDFEKLKIAYILQAAQEFHDAVTEYKKIINQKEKTNMN